MKLNSGRFDRSASSSVSSTGSATMISPAMPPAISGVRLARNARDLCLSAEPMSQHEAGQRVGLPSSATWSRPSTIRAAADAGGRAVAPGRALERARQQEERDRQPGEADHLAGVLQPRARGAAEREGQRRDQCAGRMPAAVAEIRIMPSPPSHRWAKLTASVARKPGAALTRRAARAAARYHRLRIGDLRPAREHVRRPER